MKGLNCQHHQPSIKYYLHDPHDQLSNEKSFFAHQLNSIAFRMLYAVIKTCIRSTIKCFWCVLTTTNYWIIKHKTYKSWWSKVRDERRSLICGTWERCQGWVETRNHHVTFPGLWLHFPLLGESGVPLYSQTEDVYRVSKKIWPRALKAY